MPTRSRKKRPWDVSQLGKLIVDISTGAAADEGPEEPGKNPAAVALGKLGGRKGGLARARKLSKKRRSEIAKLAATKGWRK